MVEDVGYRGQRETSRVASTELIADFGQFEALKASMNLSVQRWGGFGLNVVIACLKTRSLARLQSDRLEMRLFLFEGFKFESECYLRVNGILSNLVLRVYASRDNVRGTDMKTCLICRSTRRPPPFATKSRHICAGCFIDCCIDLRCPILPLGNVRVGAEIPSGARVVRRLVPELEVVDLVLLVLDRCHSHVPGDVKAVVPKIEGRHESCSVGEVVPRTVLDV